MYNSTRLQNSHTKYGAFVEIKLMNDRISISLIHCIKKIGKGAFRIMRQTCHANNEANVIAFDDMNFDWILITNKNMYKHVEMGTNHN